MSNSQKETVNFWTTQIMRVSVAVIGFLLIQIWAGFKEVEQDVKKTSATVDMIRTEQRVIINRLGTLERDVERNTRKIDALH